MTMNKAFNPQLVHLQRAEPDHADAGGLGQDRGRAEPLHHDRERLRRGLQLPGQPVQELVGLGLLADLVGRRRPVEAAPPSTPTATPRSCRTRRTPDRRRRGWPSSRRSRSPRRTRSTTCSRPGAAGGQKIDVGYLPTTDAPPKPANATVGHNPVNGYTLDPLYSWSINYFPLNYQSTTGNGPIIKQLYFREALQLHDEPGRGDLGSAARVRPVHGRPGRHLPAEPVPVLAGQGRATRSRTTRPWPSSC